MCKECEKEHRHFVCECGKEFKNQKAISGHQANCKVHLKLLKEEREKRRLPNGLFKCENPDCSNEHDGSYASGRFCSEECYRHVIGLRSAQSRREHTVKRIKGRSSYGTWKCRMCDKIFETRRELKSHMYEVHCYDKSHAWNYGLTKETSKSIALGIKTLQEGFASGRIQPSFKGKHHSQKTKQKLSKIMKENIKCGKAAGWKSMSDKRESFPEKFWKRVLDNNNITYQFQLKITHKSLGMTSGACYFLDFALPGKVDLEIDGQQHMFRQEDDRRRTINLEKNGWTVYRIKWNDIQSHNGKMEMKSKIDRFLQWYKNFCDVHLC